MRPLNRRGFTSVEIFTILALLAILFVCALRPYYEAKTFNKFSEKKIGYWDAVFGDFRIFAESDFVGGANTQ